MALVDTAGTLSLAKLRDILVLRLNKQNVHRLGHQRLDLKDKSVPMRGDPMHNELIRKADLFLSRVNYMRAFDMAGVIEAVSEVRESWEVADRENDGSKEKDRVVEDSEDDDEVKDEDESRQNSPDAHDAQGQGGPRHHLVMDGDKARTKSRPVNMIVIDSISNVVTSVLSKSQVQGNGVIPQSSMFSLSICDFHLANAIFIDFLRRSSAFNGFHAISSSTHLTSSDLHPSYQRIGGLQETHRPRRSSKDRR